MLQKCLYSGYVLEGKWKNNKYKIVELIGEGGIAKVYKAIDIATNDVYALKVSEDLQSLTKEYENLKKYEKLELFPRVREIDDVTRRTSLYFIVMELIEGKNLKDYTAGVQLKVRDVLGLALIIGKTFSIFHKEGYIFGDLKLENLMFDRNKKILRVIDLGGVASIGKGVKEYTPLYDRATWNKGLRKADEKYDLFSLNIFIANLLLGSTLTIKENSVDKLINRLENVDISKELVSLIHRGLMQNSISFEEYMKKLKEIYDNDRYNLRDTNNSLEQFVNYVLISSVLIFLTTVTSLIGKS